MVSQIVDSLAMVFATQEKWDDVRRVYEDELRRLDEHCGPSDPRSVLAASKLGTVLERKVEWHERCGRCMTCHGWCRGAQQLILSGMPNIQVDGNTRTDSRWTVYRRNTTGADACGSRQYRAIDFITLINSLRVCSIQSISRNLIQRDDWISAMQVYEKVVDGLNDRRRPQLLRGPVNKTEIRGHLAAITFRCSETVDPPRDEEVGA